MEAMAHEGWEPILDLWEEPGEAFPFCACMTKQHLLGFSLAAEWDELYAFLAIASHL